MELYLDSVNLDEINSAVDVGIISGVTTTPTFMHREGIEDVDSVIVELSKKVPIIQIEALGRTADEIIDEAYRQEALGLKRETTVYKIPMSMEGVKACKHLTNVGFKVNLHLVYTLQQAYMAMEAVKEALKAGAHTITIPWKIMKQLTGHHLTSIHTEQFFEHTK